MSGLRLSDDASTFAVKVGNGDDEEDEEPVKFAVAAFDSAPQREVIASDLAFAGGNRLVSLDASKVPMQLESAGWKIDLPPLYTPRLSVGETGQWRISGQMPPR